MPDKTEFSVFAGDLSVYFQRDSDPIEFTRQLFAHIHKGSINGTDPFISDLDVRTLKGYYYSEHDITIIFDLSVLKTTELPFLVHDSLIFKNIADLPIDRIMQLYTGCEKQVFISFDKRGAFTEFTAKTVYDTRVIELYDNGGELFGWSWAKKIIGDEDGSESTEDAPN